MAKKKKQEITLDFAFFEWLWDYYTANRGKIRSRYKQLTKNFSTTTTRKKMLMLFCVNHSLRLWKCMCLLKNF